MGRVRRSQTTPGVVSTELGRGLLLFVIAADVVNGYTQCCELLIRQFVTRGCELRLRDAEFIQLNTIETARELAQCGITVRLHIGEDLLHALHGFGIGCHGGALQNRTRSACESSDQLYRLSSIIRPAFSLWAAPGWSWRLRFSVLRACSRRRSRGTPRAPQPCRLLPPVAAPWAIRPRAAGR